MAFQFKVGDKVKVVDESHGWSDVKKGDIGEIKAIYCGGDIVIDFESERDWYAKSKDLELVERIAKPELPKLNEMNQAILDALKAGEWGRQRDSVIKLVSAICDKDFAPYMDEG